jgi:hypothetical protein
MVVLDMRFDTKARLVYALLIAVVIPLGLATRAMKARWPWLGDALGDALWATLAFLIVSFIFPTTPLWRRAAATVVFAFAIEFSQMYHARWIDRIRRTTAGGIVLGSSFDALDLIYYSVGVAVGMMLERLTLWRRY